VPQPYEKRKSFIQQLLEQPSPDPIQKKLNIKRNLSTLNFNLFVRQNYEKYDPFSNGWLSKDEFKEFLKASNRAEEADREFDDAQFDALFAKYDNEQNGIILKDDMLKIHLTMIGVGDPIEPLKEAEATGEHLEKRLNESFHSDPEAFNFSDNGSSDEMERISAKDSDGGGEKREAD
jgi:hypothetical protein